MAAGLPHLVGHLRRLASPPGSNGDTDAALLDRFIHHRDEAAFEALVRRHGPMVHRLCRRVTGDATDADDAFQAAFLVLARRASTIRRPDSLAAWLHGVAYRAAHKARGNRPAPRELVGEPIDRHPDPLDELTARELLTLLDEEVGRLPEAYRLPVVLCYLEGRTLEEAAWLLGWTRGMVKGRLERARARMQARLTRRGLALSAVLAVLELTQGPAAAGVPALVLAAAVRGTISARAGALADALLKGAAWMKSMLATALVLMAGVGTAGVGLLAHQSWARQQLDLSPALQNDPDPQKAAPIARAPSILPHTVRLTFGRSAGASIHDVNGLATGLTHRLPGTGSQLPEHDPNLRLDPDKAQLELTITRSDLNQMGALWNTGSGGGGLRSTLRSDLKRQISDLWTTFSGGPGLRSTPRSDLNPTGGLLFQGEYLGLRLSDLGFTGKEDFAVTATIPNIPVPQPFGQFGLYAGTKSDRNIRGGLITWNLGSGSMTQFLVNNNDGPDTDLCLLGLLSPGTDVRLTLKRTSGKYALTVEDLTTRSASTLTTKDLPVLGTNSVVVDKNKNSPLGQNPALVPRRAPIAHPVFLDNESDLYVGLLGADPTNNALRGKTLIIKEFAVTVWPVQSQK
jgi:RNA polymerase sigma factor (sigma-70 family)